MERGRWWKKWEKFIPSLPSIRENEDVSSDDTIILEKDEEDEPRGF